MVWAELQVREPLDENCREMRFTGFYQVGFFFV